MRSERFIIALFCVPALLAGGIAGPRAVSAQDGIVRNGAVAAGTTNIQPLIPPDSSIAPGVPANPTLEIKPHVIAAPTPAAASTPAQPDDDDLSDATGTLDDALHNYAPKPPAPVADTLPGLERPYIGLSAQYIETHDPPWHTVKGLEVVSVDHGGPAERAGLRGRGAMTSVGETGATASSMAAPLNLIVMPLLKKSGSLGESGDLIVAIDDRRVDNAEALKSALDRAKPGDTLYFTIERTVDGKSTTIKVPVKLAEASEDATGTASETNSGN
jgi:PDZ domain